MNTPLYPLSFQQKALLSRNQENEDVITVSLRSLDTDKISELLVKFLNTIEALKIKYVTCYSLAGYSQSVRSSILYAQTDRENKDNFSSGKIHFSISKHDLIVRIPGGRLDSISLKLLAAKLIDFLEGAAPLAEACDYIDFACWQCEQPLIQLSESIRQSLEATDTAFKDFSERALLVERFHNEGALISFPLRHLSNCSSKHLLKAFTWVLWETFGIQKVIVDIFSSSREELGLQDRLGMFEFCEPCVFETKDLSDEGVYAPRKGYTPVDTQMRSPFTFRYYCFEQAPFAEIIPLMVTSKIGIEQHIVEGKSIPVLNICYALNKNSFASILIERLTSAFHALNFGSYRTLLPGEKERQLLSKFSYTGSLSSEEKGLFMERLQEVYRNHPERKALSFKQSSLSFGELNAWSDCVKDFLIENTVSYQDRVVVSLPRSEWMVVLIIGIIKAGGIFTPIDPSYPVDRKNLMIKESQPKLVIDSLDPILKRDPKKAGKSPPIQYNSSDVVYSIFTSGTQGNPNLVDISHGNLTHLIDALNTRVYASFKGAILNIALNGSFSFDTSVKQWAQLANGHHITVLSDEIRLNPPELAAALRSHKIDVIDTTPSHLETWLDYLDSLNGPHLFTVLVGGEAISYKLWRKLSKKERVQFFNLYGPTECTVDATVAAVGASPYPVIGAPLPGVRVASVNKECESTKIGEEGELLISGWGLSRGYPNNPELTKEKFQFSSIESMEPDRWYRTGDLVTWSFSGDLIYKGRADHQIKVRGYRVELSEIQRVILEIPGIANAYLTKNIRGSLIAFLHSAQADEEEVRAELEKQLPLYAIPTEIFLLREAFPLTLHGKIDESALMKRIQRNASPNTFHITCPKQKTILKIMQELLSKQISPETSFFAAGGDSILGIQLVARAKREGIKIPILKIFTHQSAKQLATVSEGSPVNARNDVSIPSQAFPLSPIQRAFLARDCLDRNHWNQSRVLRIPVTFSLAQIMRAFEQLYENHPSLRLRLILEEGIPKQRFSSDHAHHFDSVSVACPEAIDDALKEHSRSAQLSLDVERGPLISLKVFQSPLPYHLVFVAVHHFAIDGLSWDILLKNLDLLLTGQSLDNEQAYYSNWIEQLEQHPDLPPPSKFKVASLSDTSREGTIREEHFSFESELSSFLTRSGFLNQYGVRAEEILLAGLVGALLNYSDEKTILLDHETHGRDVEVAGVYDFSNTIGWFTNVSSLGFDCSDDTSALDILSTVKNVVRTSAIRGLKINEQKKTCFSNILFNYFGEMGDQLADSLSVVKLETDLDTYKDRSGEKKPCYEVEIDVYSKRGMIEVFLEYDGGRISDERFGQFKVEWIKNCNRIVEELLSYENYLWTESDFPDVGLTAEQIRHVFDQGVGVSDLWPLTELQEEMLGGLQAESPWKYLFCIGLQVEIGIDPSLFEDIWNRLFERFATLRAVIRSVNGKNVQLIKNSSQIAIRQESGKDMIQVIHEEKMRGFDRSHEPPLRASLVPKDNDKTEIIYTIDLTRIDLTSYFILFELAHNALLQIEVEETHQRDWNPFISAMHGKGTVDQGSFWTGQLLPHICSSPYSYEISKIRIPAYEELKLTLPAHETVPFRVFAREAKTTLNLLFLGIWALCEARINDYLNPVIGVTLGGRSLPLNGIEKMVGRFVTTLPFHVPIDGNMEMVSWLQILQTTLSEMMSREIVTKGEIKQMTGLEREKKLYQTNFVYENDPVGKAYYRKYRIIETPIYHSSPETPLRIEISPFKSEDIEFRLGFLSECIGPMEAENYFNELLFLLKNFGHFSRYRLGELLTMKEKT